MSIWKAEDGQALGLGDKVLVNKGRDIYLGTIVGNPNSTRWQVRREKILSAQTMQFEPLPSGGPWEAYDVALAPDLTRREWRRRDYCVPGVTLLAHAPARPWRPGMPGRAGVDFDAPVPFA